MRPGEEGAWETGPLQVNTLICTNSVKTTQQARCLPFSDKPQSCQPSRFECEGHAISPLNTPHATLAISHSHLHTFHLSRKLWESPWIYTGSRSMFTVLYTFIYIYVVRRCRLPKRTDLQANNASRIEAFLAWRSDILFCFPVPPRFTKLPLHRERTVPSRSSQ